MNSVCYEGLRLNAKRNLISTAIAFFKRFFCSSYKSPRIKKTDVYPGLVGGSLRFALTLSNSDRYMQY